MGKTAVITCSTSGIDYIDGYEGVVSSRTTIVIDGKEYKDGADMKPEEFYQNLNSYETIPTTAQPSPGQLLDIYTDLKDKGYTEAIYISISDQLSGTYQSICLSSSYLEDFAVYPFNSASASYLTAYMAMEAYRLSEEGMDAQGILRYLEKIRDNDHILFMVDDLKYLVKNGRLSNASAFVANMLQIKPLLEIGPEGKITATEKIRTSKKAINRIVQHFLEETNNGADSKFTFLFNTDAPDYVALVKKKLEDVGFNTDTMITAPISPAVGCHIGKGVIGIGYVKNFD